MKKIFIIICVLFFSATAIHAQGLQGLQVEKYYVSNAADAAGSIGTLPVGSVTWRFYADLAPGWKLQAVYGVDAAPVGGSPSPGDHDLKLITSTAFFNNEDRGATTPNAINFNFMDDNTVMLDSWLSVGGAAGNKLGVNKSEDDGVATVVNSNGILQNNDASAGIPLTVQDGFLSGTPEAVTFVGLGSLTDVFDATSNFGNSFVTNNGSWASLNGSVGPTATNKVLIAQITTDGVLQYAFNVQVANIATSAVENYVWDSPVGTEILMSSLSGTLNQPNICPTTSITAPIAGASFLVGDNVQIDATAADSDGTVTQVEFFINNVSIGIDNTAPYSINWVATAGTKNITVSATDDGGCVTTSSVVTINVGSNIAPTVAIVNPGSGSTFVLGDIVSIDATAADADGTISQVEFFVNSISVGVDNTSPYSVSWPSVLGSSVLTAVATDNNNATATSAAISIQVFDSASAYALISNQVPCASGKFCIPLNALAPVNDVIGYDVVLDYDKSKVTPTGVVVVSNNLINPSITSVATSTDTTSGLLYISLFFNSSAPPSAEFNGTGEVFCVEFVRTAGFNSSDTALFLIPSLQESYFTGVMPKVVSPGSISTFTETEFNAELRFWSDFSTLGYDGTGTNTLITNIYGSNSTCDTLSLASIQPDANGMFIYDITNGNHVSIQRNIDDLTSVQAIINGFDAFLTRRVLINDAGYVPSAYELINMDVNLDGVVSAGDLSQINQRAILQIGEFRQNWNYNPNGTPNGAGPSKDWLFVDQTRINSDPGFTVSASFPFDDGIGYSKSRVPQLDFCLDVPLFNTTGCTTIGNETYVGLIPGDVNGNFATVGSGGLYRTEERNIIMDFSNSKSENGYVTVPVLVSSLEPIYSIDLALLTDNSKLVVESISALNASIETLDHTNVADQTFRFTSYSLQAVDNSIPVLNVRFKLSDVNADEKAISYSEVYLNGEKATLSFNRSGNSSTSEELIVSVFPNPTSDIINVLANKESLIQLYTVEGKELRTLNHSNINELIEFNVSDLAKGIYMLKITSSESVKTEMIVIN